MRKLLIVLLILSVSFSVAESGHIQRMHQMIINQEGSSVSYIFQEDFDSTGYDNSNWVESPGSGGTINEDYSAEVLDGTYSLSVESGPGQASSVLNDTDLTATDPMYGYFIWQNDVEETATDSSFFVLLDSGDNFVLELRWDISDDTIDFNCGNSGFDAGGTYSVGTTYHFWWEYDAGTSNDTVCRVWIATSDTKPGSVTYEKTDGNTANSADKVRFFKRDASARSIFDKIRMDDVSIGSSPQ